MHVLYPLYCASSLDKARLEALRLRKMVSVLEWYTGVAYDTAQVEPHPASSAYVLFRALHHLQLQRPR